MFLRHAKAPEENNSDIPKDNTSNKQDTMELISTAFSHGEAIPKKYSCDGEDINPPLQISDIPAGTETLALVVDDPDAPGGTFDHWIAWNIDPETTEITENSVPEGAVQGKNDFGNVEYGGPCPPGEEHRYFFKLYALDTELELDKGSTKQDFLEAAEGHILQNAELMATYDRS